LPLLRFLRMKRESRRVSLTGGGTKEPVVKTSRLGGACRQRGGRCSRAEPTPERTEGKLAPRLRLRHSLQSAGGKKKGNPGRYSDVPQLAKVEGQNRMSNIRNPPLEEVNSTSSDISPGEGWGRGEPAQNMGFPGLALAEELGKVKGRNRIDT